MHTLNYTAIGNQTVLIEWPKVIAPEIHDELLAFRALVKLYSNKIQETVITYNAIALYLKHGAIAQDLITEIKQVISLNKVAPKESPVIWEIPVCYDHEFAPDLARIMAHTKLSSDAIISRHTKPLYRIYFCGFLPGFIYLGGLDQAIATPRLDSPRLKVPKGGVGIAGLQTGIYPSESPGGWNLIGRCPLSIFSPYNPDKPSPFNAGQRLQFKSITKARFLEIKDQIAQGRYKLKPVSLHD